MTAEGGWQARDEVRYPGAILRRPESKPSGFQWRLWLIVGVGGLIGLGFLARSQNRRARLRTGAYVRVPNSAGASTVPIVSGYEDSAVRPEPVLIDPVVRADLAMGVPKRRTPRRLLVGGLAVLGVCAAVSGVFVGVLVSDHRQAALLTDAAATPPPLPKATTGTAPKAANSAVSTTTPPISPRATISTAPKAANSAVSTTTPPISPRASVSTPPKAANPAASTTPTSSPARSAAAPQITGSGRSSRLFAWASVASAKAYTVEITRNGKTVYSATTSVPRVRVPSRWRRDGRTMTLSPGTYIWYVWPVFHSGTTTRNLPPAVVASKFTITP